MGSDIDTTKAALGRFTRRIRPSERPLGGALVTLRMVVPASLVADVLAAIDRHPGVCHIVHHVGAARSPVGDVILCDAARETVSLLLAELREIGLADRGAINVEEIGCQLSSEGSRLSRRVAGAPGDAVVWELLEAQTSQAVTASVSFFAFMVLATLIATVGIMLDSPILIVGAMVVGPEFGPIAALSIAFAQRRTMAASSAVRGLLAGFSVAVVAAFVASLLLRAVSVAPDALTDQANSLARLISHPDTFSVIVALSAGVAGMLSLTSGRSAVLIGVFISVTTIPAASNIGVEAAYGRWRETLGSGLQLLVNLLSLVAAGLATLAVHRRATARSRVSAPEP